MPLVNVPVDPPQPPPGQGVVQAKVTPANYQHSLLDTKINPVSGIITHIDGLDWTVDYYSQFLGLDEETENYAPSQLQPYQQYHFIQGYVLKLQGGLNNSTDPDTNAMTITGEALTTPSFKPNIGDAFIADVGDGRLAIFTVTETEKKTYYKQTVYSFSFKLQEFINSQQQINTLNSFVVKRSRYVVDFTNYGQNPILAESEITNYTDALSAYDDLANYWFNAFFEHESGTVLVPDQPCRIYDPYIVRTMMDMVDNSKNPYSRILKLPNVDDHNVLHQKTIWDALIQVKSHLLFQAFRAYGLLSRDRFHSYPAYGSVRYSSIDHVLVPITLQSVAATGYNYYDPQVPTLYQTMAVGFLTPSCNPTPPTSTTAEDGLDIPKLGDNQVYMFGMDLFNGTPPQTRFEAIVQDYLDQQTVDLERTLKYVQACFQWGRVEQFYYIPVLLMLLNSGMRRL